MVKLAMRQTQDPDLKGLCSNMFCREVKLNHNVSGRGMLYPIT